jgi:hypothetical protein
LVQHLANLHQWNFVEALGQILPWSLTLYNWD